MNSKIGAVVLAAGRGSRLNCGEIPKVLCEIGGKPIVEYTVETLHELGLPSENICLVVGYKKEKVMDHFGNKVSYAEQAELLGTAHATFTGMVTLPEIVEHVLVLGGDDSAFYTKESLEAFIKSHISGGHKLSLLSVNVDDPHQLGRVVRHDSGDIEIIEKEYLTEKQAKLDEISTGTFCFDRKWFESIFPNMPKMRKLGEYGLPTAMAMVREAKLPYQVVSLGRSNEWFGVNTREQLEEAHKRKQDSNSN